MQYILNPASASGVIRFFIVQSYKTVCRNTTQENLEFWQSDTLMHTLKRSINNGGELGKSPPFKLPNSTIGKSGQHMALIRTAGVVDLDSKQLTIFCL